MAGHRNDLTIRADVVMTTRPPMRVTRMVDCRPSSTVHGESAVHDDVSSDTDDEVGGAAVDDEGEGSGDEVVTGCEVAEGDDDAEGAGESVTSAQAEEGASNTAEAQKIAQHAILTARRIGAPAQESRSSYACAGRDA